MNAKVEAAESERNGTDLDVARIQRDQTGFQCSCSDTAWLARALVARPCKRVEFLVLEGIETRQGTKKKKKRQLLTEVAEERRATHFYRELYSPRWSRCCSLRPSLPSFRTVDSPWKNDAVNLYRGLSCRGCASMRTARPQPFKVILLPWIATFALCDQFRSL